MSRILYRFWKWLKPSYSESLIFLYDPSKMPNNEWVTFECSMDGVQWKGIQGKWHRVGMWTGQMKIKHE